MKNAEHGTRQDIGAVGPAAVTPGIRDAVAQAARPSRAEHGGAALGKRGVMGGVGGLRGGAAPPLAPCPRRRRPKRCTQKSRHARRATSLPGQGTPFTAYPFAQPPRRRRPKRCTQKSRHARRATSLPGQGTPFTAYPFAQPPRRRRPKCHKGTKPPRPQGNQPPAESPPPSGGTPSRAAPPSAPGGTPHRAAESHLKTGTKTPARRHPPGRPRRRHSGRARS